MTIFAAVIGSAGMRLRPGTLAHRGMMLTAAAVALTVGGWWLVVGT
jgi:hypothetical protein